MLSLEPELQSLRAQLGDRAVDALVARERREIFSVDPELRIAGWLGATLLAAAAGVLLKNNLDRIGPLALSVMIGLAALACYAWCWWRRGAASVIDDYVLLLGALLVSADVAFIESQYHLLDDAWKHHLLLLAAVHAAGAYAWRSRMLLALSIMALAGWIGFDETGLFEDVFVPAVVTAAVLLVWREIDRRVMPSTTFSRTFEHFAASIALLGALTYAAEHEVAGGLAMIAIAAVVIAWGFRTRGEAFVLYGFVCAVIGFTAIVLERVRSESLTALVIVVTTIGAIVGLLKLHAWFRKEAR